jgi:hypothetical protein
VKLLKPGRRQIWIGIALSVAVLGAGLLLPMERHHGGWWDEVPLFHGIYGFLGCAVIVIVSKLLGKLFIQKREDHYD